MPQPTRECPRCEQVVADVSSHCPECGVEIPADLRVLRGAERRLHLRGTALVADCAVRGTLVLVMVAVAWLLLRLLGSLGTRLNPVEQVGFALVFVALPGVVALVLTAQVLVRLRALAGNRSLAHGIRWAWTHDRFWRDASTFPDGGTDRALYGAATVDARHGLLRVRLGSSWRPDETLWLEGGVTDADAIRAELGEGGRRSS